LAERFDEDPFLLFRLRGKTQDEIMEALGKLQGADGEDTSVAPEYEPPPPLSASLSDFWEVGDEAAQFQTHIAPPDAPYPALARLGAPAFMDELERWLKPAYDAMSATAVSTAYTDANENETEHDAPPQ